MVDAIDATGPPSEAELSRPATLAQRLHMLARFAYCIAASVPTTTVPPLLLTLPFYRRFRNETTFQDMHKIFAWADFCARHVLAMDIRLEGRERLPEDRRGLMFISNHQSYVDIPMVMSALRIGAFLSKSLVAYLPILGLIAWTAGTIYFRRGRSGSRRKALAEVLRMCESSTPVSVFPEGTRSADGNLRGKVHLGAVRACWERGLRIGTFALHGTRYVFPPTMDRFHGGQRVAVVVGETLSPDGFPDAESFARAAWSEVEKRFEQARAMRESPHWRGYPRP